MPVAGQAAPKVRVNGQWVDAPDNDPNVVYAANDETVDLDSMTKAELQAYADEQGIEVSGSKADILDTLQK